MPGSYSQRLADAWGQIGFGRKGKIAEVWPRFTIKDFNALKADWVQEYGYTIRIPTVDDIIHLIPRDMMTNEALAEMRKENLIRLLDSRTRLGAIILVSNDLD